MTIDELNTLTTVDAINWFMQTCTASRWCQLMVSNRPYNDAKQLKQQAARCWGDMLKNDYLEAFSGHPMIGDINSLRKKFANTKALAANEQSGTQVASDEVLQCLKAQNKAYLDKHGFIFIVCATGLSAQTMLSILEQRLVNSTEAELKTAAAEQLKITLLRIDKAFGETE
ncbi:2-oxo-4-hydroxy-4-carboxy-5-ureidoimidazoline decarboxylase [Agaribacter flavus]|uniref:2-oxo-4-hydroxy-4-carboxy-5-ureidoimidazoline decarboxylase n=1 Tax=Agaribacter flavus TaxID=1902781 RepID=A0ABV7FNI1_9ALTE